MYGIKLPYLHTTLISIQPLLIIVNYYYLDFEDYIYGVNTYKYTHRYLYNVLRTQYLILYMY